MTTRSSGVHSSPRRRARPEATPITVLIADDDAPSARQLHRLLEPFAEVRILGVARNGREAVDKVDRLRPDLLFLDIEMPRLDGFQVLQQIRHRPIVVLVTAHAGHNERATATGAMDLLWKPVEADQIRKVMDRVRRAATHQGGLERKSGG